MQDSRGLIFFNYAWPLLAILPPPEEQRKMPHLLNPDDTITTTYSATALPYFLKDRIIIPCE